MPGFDAEAAKRIAAAVKHIEQQPRNAVERPKGPAPTPAKKYAVVATAIAAIAGTTLGRGTAKLQVIAYSASGVATFADGSYAAVDVYSGASSAIAVGRLIQICVIDGHWHVDVDYC